jgi:hypothetical protein
MRDTVAGVRPRGSAVDAAVLRTAPRRSVLNGNRLGFAVMSTCSGDRNWVQPQRDGLCCMGAMAELYLMASELLVRGELNFHICHKCPSQVHACKLACKSLYKPVQATLYKLACMYK